MKISFPFVPTYDSLYLLGKYFANEDYFIKRKDDEKVDSKGESLGNWVENTDGEWSR